jgi:hypothetical protein
MGIRYRDRLFSFLNTTVDPFIVLFDAVKPGGDRENEL